VMAGGAERLHIERCLSVTMLTYLRCLTYLSGESTLHQVNGLGKQCGSVSRA
jgi:hypothetical protein